MSWAIWITGPPGRGQSMIARGVEAELRALGHPVTRLELDEIKLRITPTSRDTDGERDIVHRSLGCLAVLLVESSVPVLIDSTASPRVWRDLVREAIPRFAEVQLVGPPAICQEPEAAPAPELLIDSSLHAVQESVGRVVRLAGHLARASGAASAPPSGAGDPGWAIWITGRPGSGKSTLAARVTDALRERGGCVRRLDLSPVQRFLQGDRSSNGAEPEIVHWALVYAAKLLTEAGVSVIVDATAGRREWREAARRLIPSFAEIQLLCPTDVCLERERAVRWGLTFERVASPAVARPDIAIAYEEARRPELAIRTDVHDVQSAAERVLFVIERLAESPSRARSS